jgi:hypothetical protein
MRPFKKGTAIPRLFKGLLMSVFEVSGELRSEMDITAIRLLREAYNLFKKLDLQCEESKIHEEVRAFFQIERESRSATLNWEQDELNIRNVDSIHVNDCHHPDVLYRRLPDQLDLFGTDEAASSIDSTLGATFQSVCDYIVASFPVFEPGEWKPKHGPGAVSDLRGVDNKYLFPNWPDKLEQLYPMSEYAFANFNMWADLAGEPDSIGFSPHEPPSKLIAVPKTQKGPRLIASEPVSHQWIQQMQRKYLIHCMMRSPISSCVDFNSQKRNQDAAYNASLGSGHATVDLSSASDRMSCWVVERVFRRNPNILKMLHSSRTRWMINSIDRKSPKYILLKKFACQGSALTFPVQTLIYSIAAVASIIYDEKAPVTFRSIKAAAERVQIYGDDTVIPIDSLDTYRGLLEYLGFKVNHKKTYGTGKFRESCGTEWFEGTNVTPSYFRSIPCRTRPESVVSAIEVSNNFFVNGYFHIAEYIKSTVQRILPKNSVPFVAADSGALGWCRPMPDLDWKPRMRTHRHYQDRFIQVLGLSAKITVSPNQGSSSLLQYFIEAPEPDNIWKSGVRSRPKLNLKFRWERADFFLKPVT